MATVLRVIAIADQLPEDVRALCIDLRAVRREDLHVLRALETGLRSWRSSRSGMSRVMLPEAADGSLVALKFPHQRWSLRDD